MGRYGRIAYEGNGFLFPDYRILHFVLRLLALLPGTHAFPVLDSHLLGMLTFGIHRSMFYPVTKFSTTCPSIHPFSHRISMIFWPDANHGSSLPGHLCN